MIEVEFVTYLRSLKVRWLRQRGSFLRTVNSYAEGCLIYSIANRGLLDHVGRIELFG